MVVVGGGPAGLTAAIALAGAGLATVLVGKRPPARQPHHRPARRFRHRARNLGVWALCAAQAAPLKVMRIVDDTGRLWRAPEVKFEADEIDLDAFGYNIENRHLRPRSSSSAPRIAVAAHDRGRSRASSQATITAVAASVRAEVRAPLASAPTAGTRCAARPPASPSTSATISRSALTVCLTHFATASRHLDRIPHRQRAVHIGTTAGHRSSLVWVLDPSRCR